MISLQETTLERSPTSSAASPAGSGLTIAVIGEGTYPYVRGGVSTWVDQVIGGLPDMDFHAVALTGEGRHSMAYPSRSNLKSVHPYALWGPPRPKLITRNATKQAFLLGWEQIVAEAMSGQAPMSPDTVAAWRSMTRPDIADRVWQLANSPQAVDMVLRAHGLHFQPATVQEAGFATQFVSRMLSALGAGPIEADVVHVTTNGAPVLPALVADEQRGIPFVLSEHGVQMRERVMAIRDQDWTSAQREIVMAMTRSLALLGYSTAQNLLPVSQFNAHWSAQLGAPAERTQVLYNGVDLDAFPFVEEEPAEPVLTFVGRIDPLKDLATAVDALALIRNDVPDVRLRLFGPVAEQSRAYQEALQQRAQELGVADRLTFEGPISPPNQGYTAGQVVVLSSISEGFPYSVIEAMACGRPVVGTDVGGVREGIGEGGLVVRPGDPSAFAQACVALLSDPVERRRRARAGRALVEREFTLVKMLDELRTTYVRTAESAVPAGARR